MATRPVFVPSKTGDTLVQSMNVEFKWIPGMAKSQAQKCIASLHKAACEQLGISRVLEISSKSPDEIGVQLSAFNLHLTLGGHREMTVETAYQGSKVFENGGPYADLLDARPIDAKRDERIRSGGKLKAFRLFNEDWPLQPKSAFYDWLYVNALAENPDKAAEILDMEAFTDIAFNPAKSVNCQARGAAIYIALNNRDRLETALASQKAFLKTLGETPIEQNEPGTLWDA